MKVRVARVISGVAASSLLIACLVPGAGSAVGQSTKDAAYDGIPSVDAAGTVGDLHNIAPGLGVDESTIKTQAGGPRELVACSYAENKVDPSKWSVVTTGSGDTDLRYSIFGYESAAATSKAWDSLVANLRDCERVRTVGSEVRTSTVSRSMTIQDPAFWLITTGNDLRGQQTSVGMRLFRKVENVIQRVDGVRLGDGTTNEVLRTGLRDLSNHQARDYRQVVSDAVHEGNANAADANADAVEADSHPHINAVIDAIRAMERNTGSDTSHGSLWDLTTSNSLATDGSWIVDTHHCWNSAKTCDNTAEQQHITSTIRSIVGSGEKIVDLSGLTGFPDGGFRQAIIDGARDASIAGRTPVIRMLWGHTPLYDVGDKKLKAFQKDVQDAAPGVRVVAASAANTAGVGGYFWNHSKIVAADGKVAFIAGINMWSHSYLQSTHPVTDLGMVVTGPAAYNSQQFLDVQWRYVCANPERSVSVTNTIIPAQTPQTCPATMTPEVMSSATIDAGDVAVLSLGRGGRLYDGRLVGEGAYPAVSWQDRLKTTCPGIFNIMNGGARWDGRNPSDTGLRALVESAQSSITIFQQNMMFPCPVGRNYDVRLFDAIAKKIDAGIPVNIVTSNTSASVRDDAGLTEPESDYKALPVAKVQRTLIERVQKLGNSKQEATALVCRSLMVAPLRTSTSGKWLGAEAQYANPAMHTKMIMVDDEAFSIGSQNAYPNELAEFSYLVENKDAAKQLTDRFITPILTLAKAGAAPCPTKTTSPPARTVAGPEIAVSIGDSYISGEAGRWAGNAIKDAAVPMTDRLGASAYWDGATAEKIKGCHRSASAEVNFWPGSINLACSGAITSSKWKGVWPIGYAKPGIDREVVHGVDGQLTQLKEVARSNNVKLVLMSIGGNDFGFAKVIIACSSAYSFSSKKLPMYCKNSDLVKNAFSDSALQSVSNKITGAIHRTVTTMKNAGYADDEWTLVVQNYPNILPRSEDFRYPETNARITQGGCGFWNKDVEYINGELPKLSNAVWNAVSQARNSTSVKIKTLDLTNVFDGRKLCEKGTDVADSVSDATALADVAEFVQSLRVNVLGTDFKPAESLHPNFFGQSVLQECAKLVWNGGDPRSGVCIGPGAGPLSDGPLATLQ